MTSVTTTRSLTEAILDSGIQNTNYFNGRILNAGDLQTDQDANRQQHEQLGLAIGAGVVRGLWVELVSAGSGVAAPVVAVGQGLAFNRVGQALSLPVDVQVALTRITAPQPPDAGLFADCAPPGSTAVPVQAGIYILVATPASGYYGQAPMFSFGDVNTANGCGSRYAVEGISFRLVQLDVTTLTRLSAATQTDIANLMTQTDQASLSRLRNRIAHVCFGTEEVAGFVVDPFARTNGQSPYLTYGAIDALLAGGSLTDADVPLALLVWTIAGVQFLDRWSVRRRPVAPMLTTTWPLPMSARRRAESEACFLQFEEQIGALLGSSLSDSTVANLGASAYFRYLPAAAMVPLSSGSTRGLSANAFFAGLTIRDPTLDPVVVNGAQVAQVLAEAVGVPPIDLTSNEHIWLYWVRENRQAIDAGGSAVPQSYIVFTSGQIGYRGDGRYDLIYADYGNYA